MRIEASARRTERNEDEIVEVDLGSAGLDHVRDRLRSGKALSRCLLDALPLEQGAVTTEVPTTVASSELLEPGHGGVVDSEASRTQQIDLIVAHLASSADAIAVFEDRVARPSDPIMARCPTKVLTVDDEVYHLLDHRDANAHAVEVTSSWQASAAGELVVLSCCDPAPALEFPAQTTQDQLRVIADDTRAILVDVFDGEGFAIWSRSS